MQVYYNKTYALNIKTDYEKCIVPKKSAMFGKKYQFSINCIKKLKFCAKLPPNLGSSCMGI